ncbi:high-affinity nickel-transporter [Rhodoplanes sp. Z2-YC6860]|nr:nickel/cobalt transporter [Rhodoplanes sp. Z2-YC6860]AMN39844.1 high-affinity nickel-transporter [Rhodoplanes sp. Z2-YC6860]
MTKVLQDRRIQGRLVVALTLVAAAASMWLLAGHFDVAAAQAANPFGGPKPPAATPSPSDGLIGWMFAKQAEFYRDLSRIIRAAKSDGSAVWTLLGVSFVYGIFHAAGPGHGKAVISSYLVANEETWRRGIVLSFASALLQAIVAVAIVGVAAVLLNATAGQMCSAERVIELVSYALIALVGARLIWVKGRGFLSAARSLGRPLHAVGAAVTPPHDHKHHDHDHHGHDHHHDHAHHDHAHDHGHDHDHHHHDHGHHHGHGHDHHHHGEDEHASAWGHAHGPEPEELAGPGGWQRGLSAIVAVGLRPCSGAIIVLVFALAQGLFWAGVAATFMMGIGTAITVACIATLAVAFRSAAKQIATTRSGYGMLTMRGIEVGAAVLVLAFGVLLLLGYLAVERGACF